MVFESEVEFDWVSCYPSLHLSFILSNILPQYVCCGEYVNKHYTNLKHICSQIEAISTQHRIQLSGEVINGCLLPIYKDKSGQVQNQLNCTVNFVDRNIQLSVSDRDLKDDEVLLLIDSQRSEPGYFRIKVLGDVQRKNQYTITDENYLSVKFVRNSIPHYSRNVETLIQHLNDAGVKRKSFTETTDVKTSLPQDILNSPDVKMLMDFDKTIAFTCDSWPKEALDFNERTRKSGWPDEDLVKKITEKKVFAVPRSELEWTYCFSIQEDMLFNKLNNFQKQVYSLFCLLIKAAPSLSELLKPKYVKNIFLWICEKIPQREWKFKNIGTFFVYIIDYILEGLINEDMPHYFVSGYNLYADINLSEDVLDRHKRKLAKLRTHPIKPLYAFISNFTFDHLPQEIDLEKLLFAIEENKTYDTLQKVFNKHHQCLELLSKQYCREKNVSAAFNSGKDACSLLKKYVELNDITTEKYLAGLISNSSSDDAIKIYECLLELFPDSVNNYMYLGNLACMFHAKYKKCTDENQTLLLKTRTQETFQRALSHSRATSSTRTDYATFLYNMKDYKSLLEIVDNIIFAEQIKEHDEMDGNEYSTEEKITVDKNIQQEIESRSGPICFLSYTYAHYMKVQSLRVLERTFEGNIALGEFKLCCDNMLEAKNKGKEIKYLETSFVLLGYAAKDLQEYTMASNAFAVANKLNPKNTLAENLRDECYGYMMSMGQDIEEEDIEDIKEETSEHKEDKPSTVEEFGFGPLPEVSPIQLPSDIRRTHREFAECEDEKLKDEKKQLIHKLFQNNFSSSETNNWTKMEYATFLWQISKYDRAMEILDDILRSETKNHYKNEITYNYDDIYIIDYNLQDEVAESDTGQVTLLIYINAYHLIIKCLMHQDQYDEAKKYLQKLVQECEEIPSEKLTSTNFMLLGHLARNLADYSTAKSLYEKVLNEDESRIKQYISLCEEKERAEDPNENSNTLFQEFATD